MKRLLILGSVEDFTNLTKEAKSQGIYTVVVDAAINGDAKRYADKFYDVAVQDEENVNSIIKYERIDHILTSFSDNLFEYMVRYSHVNNLPCYCALDKVRFVRDKYLMKKMFEELNIPTAKGQVIDANNYKEEDIFISYPFVVKPVDGWGSKGIFIVNDFCELQSKLYESATYSTDIQTILLEEINTGFEMNIMSWVKNGTITFIEFSDREVYGSIDKELPHYNRVIFPAVYKNEISEIVRSYLRKIAKYMGINEGPLSMQLFYDKKSNKLSVGEVAGRFFGVEQEIATIINGVDLNHLLINMTYNPEKNWDELKNYEKDINHCSAVIYIKAKKGVVRDLGNVEEFIYGPNIDKAVVYAYPGAATSSLPVLMCVYAHFDNRHEADVFTNRMYNDLFIPGLNGENLAVNNKLPSYETF